MDEDRRWSLASNAGLLELEQRCSHPAAAAAGGTSTDMPSDVDKSHGAQGSENADHGYYDLGSGHRGRRY